MRTADHCCAFLQTAVFKCYAAKQPPPHVGLAMQKFWIYHRLSTGSMVRENDPIEARDAEEAVARYHCRMLNNRDLALYDDWDELARKYTETHGVSKGASHVHAELVE